MKKKREVIGAFMVNSELVMMDEWFRGVDIEGVIKRKKVMKGYAEEDGAMLV
ncbi:hypothetical protein [Bacillus sp. WP8]|uniref:hypothetical protein n=1 Tax=Bacillus sp. WP8 TaxID=756828 RepID=UPI0016423840|nr:hypothetical protein [Bacillus sp. WP8]